MTLKLPILVFCLFLLWHSQVGGIESSPLEPWVAKCTITSGDGFVDADARAVAGGVSMEKHGKWGWCPLVQSAEGVLVVHPLAQNKPALIRYKISSMEDKSKKLVIVARGSEIEPGVSFRVIARSKSLKEATLGRQWQKIEIPIADLPSLTDEIVFEIHAIQWNTEYCYIDFVGIK